MRATLKDVAQLAGVSSATVSYVLNGKRTISEDTRRRVNYKHYTDREWGMAQNYHITLDSGLIGIEKCVDIILDLVQDKTDG